MLWWFIGVWLASGAVIPALLLLCTASRGVLRNIEAEQRQAAEESHSAATSASVVRADKQQG
jgi:hypothetical protein